MENIKAITVKTNNKKLAACLKENGLHNIEDVYNQLDDMNAIKGVYNPLTFYPLNKDGLRAITYDMDAKQKQTALKGIKNKNNDLIILIDGRIKDFSYNDYYTQLNENAAAILQEFAAENFIK